MECNRDEAMRAKTIAEGKLEKKDFAGAKKFALKAQSLYPQLEGLPHMLTTIDVYISAENKISGEVDWYGVLGVKPTADEETVRKQYRKLALLLHPDKNKSAGADGAFKLICEAWSLLSDKSKRLAYNMRRCPNPKGFHQNVQMRASGSSAPARPNGYHNYASRTSSTQKPPHASTRMPPPSVPQPSCQRTDTFWTICQQCKMHYEYLKIYLNNTLLCPNCHQAFLAKETAPPFNHPKSSNSSSRQRHHNSGNYAAAGSSFHPGRNAPSMTKDSGHGPAGNPPFIFSNLQQRPPNVGSMGPSIAAKAANVVQQAHEKLKRERDQSQAAAGWERNSGPNSSFVGEGLYKKTRLNDDSYRCGANMTYNWAMGNGGPSSSITRRGGLNADKIPRFSGSYSKPDSLRELTSVEIRNMLVERSRKEILKTLNDRKSQTATKAVSIENLKVKESKSGKERSTINNNGHDQNGTVEPSATTKITEQVEKSTDSVDAGDCEKSVTASMIVPDPDFHDFDLDRVGSSFEDNEVWASYDDEDGMPRFYAMIHKVISRDPFKVKLSWLNSKTTSEFGSLDWVGLGFYKTSGEFRLGKHEINKYMNGFSHKVKWLKGPRGVIYIFPKKADVWALYKNWSPDWNESTPDDVIHKYDMVVVLGDYTEEGVSVAPLTKVAGFKTVFLPHSDPEKVRKIPKEEMFRFSHQVPKYLLSGEEAPDAPKGCLELDPAAVPLELLQVAKEPDDGDITAKLSTPETRIGEMTCRIPKPKEENMVGDDEAMTRGDERSESAE